MNVVVVNKIPIAERSKIIIQRQYYKITEYLDSCHIRIQNPGVKISFRQCSRDDRDGKTKFSP